MKFWYMDADYVTSRISDKTDVVTVTETRVRLFGKNGENKTTIVYVDDFDPYFMLQVTSERSSLKGMMGKQDVVMNDEMAHMLKNGINDIHGTSKAMIKKVDVITAKNIVGYTIENDTFIRIRPYKLILPLVFHSCFTCVGNHT